MWHGIHLSVRLTSWQKLDEQNPLLWKQYISLFDEDMLRFLKAIEFLDPIHSIHFLVSKFCCYGQTFSCTGMLDHNEVFLKFFLDPSRSGKYHLTPQHHADIVVWMIQYYYPLPVDKFFRRFQIEDHRGGPLPQLVIHPYRSEAMNQTMVIPIDIHLSHASRCAEQLIEIIRSYNPDTFPLMAHSKVRGIVVYYYHS